MSDERMEGAGAAAHPAETLRLRPLSDAEIGAIHDATNEANPDRVGRMFYRWADCPNLDTDLRGEPWFHQYTRDFVRRVEAKIAEQLRDGKQSGVLPVAPPPTTAAAPFPALRDEEYTQAAVMRAIELTIRLCDLQEQHRIPRQARVVDYADVVERAKKYAATAARRAAGTSAGDGDQGVAASGGNFAAIPDAAVGAGQEVHTSKGVSNEADLRGALRDVRRGAGLDGERVQPERVRAGGRGAGHQGGEQAREARRGEGSLPRGGSEAGRVGGLSTSREADKSEVLPPRAPDDDRELLAELKQRAAELRYAAEHYPRSNALVHAALRVAGVLEYQRDRLERRTLSSEQLREADKSEVLPPRAPDDSRAATSGERVTDELRRWLDQGYTANETPLDGYGKEVLREVLAELHMPPSPVPERDSGAVDHGASADASAELPRTASDIMRPEHIRIRRELAAQIVALLAEPENPDVGWGIYYDLLRAAFPTEEDKRRIAERFAAASEASKAKDESLARAVPSESATEGR